MPADHVHNVLFVSTGNSARSILGEALLASSAAAAFVKAFRYMRNRIAAFVALPVTSLDRMTLQARLRAIGSMPGASLRKPHVA